MIHPNELKQIEEWAGMMSNLKNYNITVGMDNEGNGIILNDDGKNPPLKIGEFWEEGADLHYKLYPRFSK